MRVRGSLISISNLNRKSVAINYMSAAMQEEVVVQGLKLDHIIKKSKSSLDHAKKSKDILIQVAHKQMKTSTCYKFVVVMSLFLIALFVLGCCLR